MQTDVGEAANAANDTEARKPLPTVPGAAVYTRAQLGMNAPRVTVEAHVGGGLPRFTLVGMPETAVREARDRVRSALETNRLRFPPGRVVVNLAPADLAKQGGRFDLAIAISLLAATRQIPAAHLHRFEFLAELGLFGALRHTRGVLSAALALQGKGRTLVVPDANRAEADLLPEESVITCGHLSEVLALVSKGWQAAPKPSRSSRKTESPPDLIREVKGQKIAKRALQVAAAGGHHLLMVGPPGAGKTLLARCMTGLLPRLTEQQALEVAAIYSSAALIREDYQDPPWRDPHHSATVPAIIGGGSTPSPGEVSLAHQGVLFLDEMPHFQPRVLNLLREPLESHQASISRANYQVTFPASFQLIAAMNPCPAGRVCSAGLCRCRRHQVQAYQARISGPLLDRIDMQLWLPPISREILADRREPAAERAPMAAEVAAARCRQLERQGELNGRSIGPRTARVAPVAQDARKLLMQAVERYQLSARSFHKLIKVAWTIADLNLQAHIGLPEMAEALSYRALDWEHMTDA